MNGRTRAIPVRRSVPPVALWSPTDKGGRVFSGVLAALPAVVFAFGGVEVIGLAASETERPEHTLPQAIRGIIYRIIFIYVGSLAVVMMLYPWNRFEPTKSPFVLVLQQAGLSAAAGIVTFVAITALLSSCNCGLFASSRMLCSLAC